MMFQQRGLKGLSLFMLLLGLVGIVVGAIMVAFAADAPDVAGVENPIVTAQIGGGMMIAEGVLYVITAILGIRAANDPKRIVAFLVFDAIVALANVVGLILVVTGGSGTVWQYILYITVAVIAGVYAVVANRAQDAQGTR